VYIQSESNAKPAENDCCIWHTASIKSIWTHPPVPSC